MSRHARSDRSGTVAAALAWLCTLAVVFAPLLMQRPLPSWAEADPARAGVAALVFLLWLLPSWWLVRRHQRLQRDARMIKPGAHETGTNAAVNDAVAVLVVYASQTGSAEHYARQTVATLNTAQWRPQLLELSALDADTLRKASQILFVVSTTGEGDAPDSALSFITGTMSATSDLTTLRYGLLALGDRDYDSYCAFGHRLDNWLRSCGAQPWFDLVEVDNGDAGALRHWQHHLGVISSHTEMPDWSTPRYTRWRLTARMLANPGSLGDPAFHLRLQPPEGERCDWQAGDIAEIGPHHAADEVTAVLCARGWQADAQVRIGDESLRLDEALARVVLPQPDQLIGSNAQAVIDVLPALPHREYSIASIAADGHLDLLVRSMRRPDGRAGLGSGWLCLHAPIAGPIALRVRRNSSFHAPVDDRPLILIGNGTGIAGLRALLRERIAGGRRRNWLLFGERSRQHDYFWQDEIEAWRRDGGLAELDLAFSRDQPDRRVYVQHVLHAASVRLREWVAAGAAIHVCGSLHGMAPAVDAVLADVFGEAGLQQLSVDGRYRRDVY